MPQYFCQRIADRGRKKVLIREGNQSHKGRNWSFLLTVKNLKSSFWNLLSIYSFNPAIICLYKTLLLERNLIMNIGAWEKEGYFHNFLRASKLCITCTTTAETLHSGLGSSIDNPSPERFWDIWQVWQKCDTLFQSTQKKINGKKRHSSSRAQTSN